MSYILIKYLHKIPLTIIEPQPNCTAELVNIKLVLTLNEN